MKYSPTLNKIAALALVAAFPFAAAAQSNGSGLSYNYVQGGYVGSNTDAGDTDGWGLGGSVAVHPNVHLFGNFASHEIDGTSVDIDQWRAGVGYNRAFSPNADFVANIAYDRYDAGAGLDFDGYSAEAGVRGALSPMFEGYALLGYEDGGDFDGDAYGRLGATVKFNRTWGVNADVKFADGDTQYFVGPRLTW